MSKNIKEATMNNDTFCSDIEFISKHDSDKSILTISPKAFDEAVWQTETGFDEQEYNNWLKKSAAVLQKTYENIEGVVETGELYLLGDVINLLDIITIKVRKGD